LLDAMAVPVGDIPVDVRQRLTFWSAGAAGVCSASATHWLDVGKVHRQLGRALPAKPRGFMVGLPMGAVAQGERFAVTLVLDAVLQGRLKRWEQEQGSMPRSSATRVVSFGLSMLSAGASEALANPPVVVKNYQIAHECSARAACAALASQGPQSFFRGVGPGVLRKSLANGLVLQSIAPTRAAIQSALGADASPTGQAVVGFLAGALTGGAAEVATNHLDRVKTMMQTKGMGVVEAAWSAAEAPLRGAGWAAARKAAIRGINWGMLGLLVAGSEALYRCTLTAKFDRAQSPVAARAGDGVVRL